MRLCSLARFSGGHYRLLSRVDEETTAHDDWIRKFPFVPLPAYALLCFAESANNLCPSPCSCVHWLVPLGSTRTALALVLCKSRFAGDLQEWSPQLHTTQHSKKGKLTRFVHVRAWCALNGVRCETNFCQWSVYCPQTLCPSIPANMAEEEVAELVVGNGSGTCKAGSCW